MGLGNDEMLPMTQNDVANGVRVEFQVSMDWGMLQRGLCSGPIRMN
jgi:hypothetical protein